MSTNESQKIVAYGIAITDEILDEAAYKRYGELVVPLIEKHGGRFIVGGVDPLVLEGEWPSGHQITMVEFPSMEHAKAWYNSPEYVPVHDMIPTIFRRRLLFVEGIKTSTTK